VLNMWIEPSAGICEASSVQVQISPDITNSLLTMDTTLASHVDSSTDVFHRHRIAMISVCASNRDVAMGDTNTNSTHGALFVWNANCDTSFAYFCPLNLYHNMNANRICDLSS
jgi:hypothetical protein